MDKVSIMENARELSSALRPGHLVKKFVLSALLLIPAHGLLAMGGLVLAALAFGPSAGDAGTWSVVAGWSLTGLYAAAGLIGGGVVGAASAAVQTVSTFESGIRDRLQKCQPSSDGPNFPALPLQRVRERYDQVMDQMFASTLGRVRLPALLERFVRARFRQAVVEDFLSECERRGVTMVGFPELSSWLVTKGISMATAPVCSWLRGWRFAALGVLVLLGAAPFVVSILGG